MKSEYLPAILVNGRVTSGSEARVSPLSEAFMFGRGVFETIRIHRGRVVFLADHHARLRSACEAVGLPWHLGEAELRQRCERLIQANSIGDGDAALKVMAFADVGGVGELLVMRRLPYASEHYASGFRLTVHSSSMPTGLGSGTKNTSYLRSLLAREDARSRGFDEALFVTREGQVLEGAGTNVFVALAGEVYTPALSTGILPGIARLQLLRRSADPKPRESDVTTEMLQAADEVFVTNALLGVMPVAAIDERSFDLTANPLTRQFMRQYAVWRSEAWAGCV